jgi:cell division protein FtsN
VRPPPRRGVKIVPRKRKRRLGTILFFVGLVAVLGATFAVGALAGRLSLKPSALLGSGPKATARGDKPAAVPQPELTFYRELTAPLTPPAPTPRPVTRGATKRESAPTEAPRTTDGTTPEASTRTELERAQAANVGVAAPRGEAARYTVQVAAYNARAQADALRARLAAVGLDAYVTEGEAGGTTRYRVRIGTYDTAEEARQAAVRIGAQGQVATYVTTR